MKNLFKDCLMLLNICVINVAIAENRTYVPVFWEKGSANPNLLNI